MFYTSRLQPEVRVHPGLREYILGGYAKTSYEVRKVEKKYYFMIKYI
jgi:hypothetical protein